MPVRPLLEPVYGVLASLLFAVIVFGIVCPLLLLAPTLRMRRACGRRGVRLALAAIGIPLRVEGLAHLPDGPCVAVANHASYLDGLVLTAALPGRFTFVVHDGVARWPYIGAVLRRMGVHYVSRTSAREGAAKTRQLIRQIQEQGDSLAVFAEGTFEDVPGLLPFKQGAFLIAARAGVPVVPAGIRGTRRLFGGGRRLPRWSRVEVEVGPAIAASGDARALGRAARAAVLQRCGEPDRDGMSCAGDLL